MKTEPTSTTSRSRADRLQQAGLRATAPRLAILERLERDTTHPTADDVYLALRHEHASISRSTVYNTLDSFIRAGLCRRVAGEGVRLRVDGTTHPHDHAICRICDSIFDIDRDIYPLPRPPARLPRGLTVTGVTVEYDVVCSGCGDERGRPATAPGQRGRRRSWRARRS